MSTRTARTRVLAVVLAIGLIAAACGDDGGGSAGPGDGEPKRGGTLTFGVFGENLGFDPVVSNAVGTNGGHELNAIYSSLMRWNPETKKAEPRLAESLSSNADFTQWTLKLRPGVKFTDGTTLDAEAVVYNLERYVKYNGRFSGLVKLIKESRAVDPTTVQFDLTTTWAGFPFLLTLSPGMIASPTALKACGTTPPRECSFNTNPVGAGPFVLSSFKPKEATELRKNPGYFAGEPYLDSVRFVYIAGADKTYEAIKTNGLQAGFLREADVIKKAKDEKTGGFEVLNWLGEILLLNNGVKVKCSGGKPEPICAGRADGTEVATTPITADKRIRQAVAAAIDPKVVDDRANAGAGLPGQELFQKGSSWSVGTPGPKYDPARAKALVEEVKAEGKWDGTIRFTCNNAPNRVATALAVQTMLQAVGFKVQLKNDIDLLATIGEVLTKKDFEIACWGFSIYEDEPFINLESNLSSASSGNWIGYSNPDLDAALKRSLAAKTTDEKKKAFDDIAKLWTEDVPSVGLAATAEYIAWRSEVKGIRMTSTTSVLFENAWIA
jgi:peptide/nickel transport system substrate-binding protein